MLAMAFTLQQRQEGACFFSASKEQEEHLLHLHGKHVAIFKYV